MMVVQKLTLSEMRAMWPPLERFSALMPEQSALDMLERICSGHLSLVNEYTNVETSKRAMIVFCFSGEESVGQSERFFNRFSFRLQRFAIEERCQIVIQAETIPFVFQADGVVSRAIRGGKDADH